MTSKTSSVFSCLCLDHLIDLDCWPELINHVDLTLSDLLTFSFSSALSTAGVAQAQSDTTSSLVQ